MKSVLRTLLATLALAIPHLSQADLVVTYNSANDVPVTAGSYTAEGAFSATLNFAPEVGTTLTVVENTGAAFIEGTFSNLAHGQPFVLSHNGINYRFMVNYYGGTGNDLVLQWEKVRVVAWGSNFTGELGDRTKEGRFKAADVISDGVLAGKTVISLSTGESHSLALCSDGTIAAWGSNSRGQLGAAATAGVPVEEGVPVAVDRTGVLTGKLVVAVSAGARHSLALCADGSVAAWGDNFLGQLGNNTTTDSPVPVLVHAGGVLAGKKIVAVSAGEYHSVALCSDGTAVAWGYNLSGKLGNDSEVNSPVPVPVKSDGVLAGKTIVNISAGYQHTVALCSDGTVVTWGWDLQQSFNKAPVVVSATELLSGKSIISVTAGRRHATILCSDGTLAAWGSNEYGQLGNGGSTSSSSPIPVSVSTDGVLAGKQVVQWRAGAFYNLARCSDGTLVSWGNGYEGTLGVEGMFYTNVPVAVDSTALGSRERYTDAVTGSGAAHNLALVASPWVPTVSRSRTSDVTPTSITLNGSVDPEGSPVTAFFEYGLTTSYGTAVPVTLSDDDGFGPQSVSAQLTGLTPGTIYHYRLTVVTADHTVSTVDGVFATSQHVTAHLSSLEDVAVTKALVAARESQIDITLGFAPPVGANLMVIKSTGAEFINGHFTNLEQGQLVVLSHGGMNYRFIADYHGGTGNDLVLRWANIRVVGWGDNSSGQLGFTKAFDNFSPAQLPATGTLAGRAITSIAVGGSHSLALCSDGTVAAWGANDRGQLGNNTQTGGSVPVAVDREGALAGKRVIAISAGRNSSFALCSDGTLVGWGSNEQGMLGNNGTEDSPTPVRVTADGALAGKMVVGVSAGRWHVLALCSDGSIVSWGLGVLGNGLYWQSRVPVPVSREGVLADKTVVAISSGGGHSLALCSDGTVVGWGDIELSQPGTHLLSSREPILVTSGALAGKTAVAISAGSMHSLVLCSDGTLAAWGINPWGQLGDGSLESKDTPVAVNGFGALAGKSIIGVAAGSAMSLAFCSDGTIAAWGNNSSGHLGDGTTEWRDFPVAVSQAGLAAGERYTTALTEHSAGYGGHSFALIGLPSPLEVRDATLTAVGRTTATLAGVVNPNGSPATAYFEYGLDSTYGESAPVALSPHDGIGSQSVSAVLTDLTPGSVYHYRLTATNGAGEVSTADGTFFTLTDFAAAFESASDIPLTASAFAASSEVFFDATLSFAPSPGTNLTVVNNTGLDFIQGEFGNLSHGQVVMLTFEGIRYRFIANYYGGDGNDLVLHWAPARLVTWGSGLDNVTRRLPTAVPYTGALAGKTIQSLALGQTHNLALCFDGTLVAWGSNFNGQLGDGSKNASMEPVLVERSGVLAGRRVVALAAGKDHSLALCADGTVAAWGRGGGRLGDGGYEDSLVPVVVDRTGVLAGKKIVAIAAGDGHSVALCSDGEVVRWGASRDLPERIDPAGALVGRKVVSIAAGEYHTLALCSDGAIVSWGYNSNGQLGDGTNTTRDEPVLVNTEGILAGKIITGIGAGVAHSIAMCSDGTIAAWGRNASGQLGDGTSTHRWTPVAVDRSGVLAGKSLTAVKAGGHHNVALCTDGTIAAWGAGQSDSPVNALPVVVSNSTLKAGERFFAAYADSLSNASFALVAATLHPSAERLPVSGIGKTSVTLNGRVDPNGNTSTAKFEYGLDATYGSSVSVTLDVADGLGPQAASAFVDGLLPSTRYHYRLSVTNALGTVTTSDGTFSTQLEVNAEYHSAEDVPFTASEITAANGTLSLSLNFAPATGTSLMLLKNTGAGFIEGTLQNLPHGQIVTLSFNGVVYRFMANYFGGSGNDLVLQWYGRRPVSWGTNVNGQLGVGDMVSRRSPVAVSVPGLDPDVRIASGAVGRLHSLALCTDGTVLAWGLNTSGQVGVAGVESSLVPIDVSSSGVLNGKVVIAVAAGSNHSLALCADGTVAGWGQNTSGQLGDGTLINRDVPVAVNVSGVLQGRRVVALAAGNSHSLALCSDGTIAAWGAGGAGQLGRGSYQGSSVPVAVSTAGVLAGRTVVAVSAGDLHNLALCNDGTVAAWGANISRQLGIPSGTSGSFLPLQVHTAAGGLLGKEVVAVAAGGTHSLALCSDGSIAAWGSNSSWQMGVTGFQNRSTPALLELTGELAGKFVTAISAGQNHNLARCSDGTLVAWGSNRNGELGNSTAGTASLPVRVDDAVLSSGEHYAVVIAGPTAAHNLALVSSPSAPGVETLPVTDLIDGSVTFNGLVNPAGGAASAIVEYGPSTEYGSSIAVQPANVSGSAATPVSITVADLLPSTTFHYRVRATNAGGTTYGDGMTFTTPQDGSGPKGGAMTVGTGLLAEAGVALTVRFDGWTDPSPPLAYTVLIGAEVISVEGASPLREITAPASAGEYRVTGRIRDALGNSTEVTRNIKVIATIEDWRTHYFGSPENAGDGADDADPDGDGADNLFEYIAGLVPTDPQSRFTVRVEWVDAQSDETRIVFHPVVPGRTYTVKSAQGLQESAWTPLSDSTTIDDDSERSVTDRSAEGGARFYRVEIARP